MGIVWYDGIWVILVCILMENIWIIYIGFVVIYIKIIERIINLVKLSYWK